MKSIPALASKTLLALSLAALLPAAQAAQYGQVLPADSQIGFQYNQMGVSMDGQFKRFNGELSFDTAAPEQGRIALDVELASIDAGSDEADEEVVTPTWFNVAQFPTARFVSEQIKTIGDHAYEVSGTLTIKGKSLPVVVPATFVEQNGQGVFEGAFTLKRGDFAIGEGAWAAFDIVANDIDVSFRITAAAGQ
ncbi:YceI family protein [Corticimicrobacter populi]|uniref:Polyisoprenoid-binding protein n=1 Tax=Corticimicrobacter populi TaxID=2175229 RepID=A0A2V1K0D8_9BURK|nr:YceI family protein [Corticimicrobacter populi]PWF22089.1 polyisoprenoid-binding protein [Corticimicrobacter populi]